MATESKECGDVIHANPTHYIIDKKSGRSDTKPHWEDNIIGTNKTLKTHKECDEIYKLFLNSDD